MIALVLARCYREKFGGDHMDDALGALCRLQGADRVAAIEADAAEPRPPAGRRSSSSASWAPARRPPPERRARRRPGGDRGRRAARGRARRCRSPDSSGARRGRSSGASRRRGGAELLEDADGGVIALGGGAVCSERVRAALGRHVGRLAAGLRRGGLAAGRGQRAAAGPGPRQLRGAARRARADLRGARRRDPARRAMRSWSRGRCPRCSACASSRPGRGWPGRRASRASTPRYVGDGLLGRAGGRSRAARSASPTRPSAGLYAEAVEPLAGRVEVEPGEQRQDARRGRAGAARAGAARHAARRPPGRARRRRRRRPRRLLRGDLPARGRVVQVPTTLSPRSTPPTAARPASTFPRPRTTSAPTTCRAPCSPIRTRSPTLPAEEMAAGFVEVVKTA